MRNLWHFPLVLILVFAAALLFTVAAGNGDEVVEAKPVRAKDVGGGKKLWVFVFPAHPGKPGNSSPPAYCTDGNQGALIGNFATANPNGLIFNINQDSIPLDKNAATQALLDSFGAWDSVSPTATYFNINTIGGASRPVDDGNNSVGWVGIVPKTTLAAAWVWTDANNNVTEADIFFNSFHKWGVFTTCNAQGRYEVGNVGTHEVGHVVGLDHLSDTGAYATMYPSASKGEVRKQTLTDGDKAGYTTAGGY